MFKTKIQRKIEFEADIPAHIVEAVGRIGIVRREIEVFQPAEVIEIRDIEKIVGHQVNVHDRLSFSIGEGAADPGIEKGVSCRGCFGTIGDVSAVLCGRVFQLNLDEGVCPMAGPGAELIAKLGDAVRRWYIGQIAAAVPDGFWLTTLVIPIDERQAVLEMECFYRMEIDADLATIEVGLRRHELEIGQATDWTGGGIRAFGIRELAVVNIVANNIIEQIEGSRDMSRREDQADVFLETEFGFEIRVAQLVKIGAGMDAIGRDLGNVGGAVAACDIGFDGKLIRKIIRSPDASGDTAEMLTVRGEGFV